VVEEVAEDLGVPVEEAMEDLVVRLEAAVEDLGVPKEEAVEYLGVLVKEAVDLQVEGAVEKAVHLQIHKSDNYSEARSFISKSGIF
jgi:hypothetical protein